ncbi:GNAT family N-acetyltransferase [Nocardioides panacis]|uniref:GNAT family N-acetyltransferase n=1 Tax=Nocardioides panacis TaxID=2849501 RepID=A0A975XYJ2_9ACTN|nr:GNAT family N-acetyltransferase [Nocardioides panacis]QWZ06457.1 GNAT family N-acetyltransferase [Nocardioides panacis]
MTTSLVRTRYATPLDVAAVTDLHARCSPTTLRRRFHVPVTHVPERLVRQLVSPRNGWSVLAEQCGEVVGLASAGPLTADLLEVGLIVEDRHQGSGVGSRMLRDVARDAHERGYRRLVCLAEPDNDAVLPTVRRAGLEGVPEHVDGVVEVVVALPARRRGLRRPA